MWGVVLRDSFCFKGFQRYKSVWLIIIIRVLLTLVYQTGPRVILTLGSDRVYFRFSRTIWSFQVASWMLSRRISVFFRYISSMSCFVSREISYVTFHSGMVPCTLMIINKDIFCSKSIVYIIIISRHVVRYCVVFFPFFFFQIIDLFFLQFGLDKSGKLS